MSYLLSRMEFSISMMVLVLLLIPTVTVSQFWEEEGAYCSLNWPPRSCCPDRNDECFRSIMDTFCYCDDFCMREGRNDCCPDFWEHCLGEQKPMIHSDLDYARHYGRPRG